MMRAWMVGCWLATVLPLAALLGWVWPALAARWRHARPVARWGLALVWLAGTGFLMSRPHDDSFTGLDNMTYRYLAHAFLDGRGFHDSDAVLAQVPETFREDFLFHRGPVGRPTRDRIFELAGWQSAETKPFFMPTLSLSAAGQDPLLVPERFVPLVGSLGWALLLAAGFCAGGGWGIAMAVALAVGTAWPAWFLRGFYAEGVGGTLIAGVVAVSAVRPLRGGIAWLAGFALGIAVSYHPTLVVISGPVALGAMLERRNWKVSAGLAAGLLGGLFPFWALTRWVCQPYGDWTRLNMLSELVFRAPEHRAIALALGVLALVAAVALRLGFRPSVRHWVRRLDERASPWGWLAAWAAPGLLIVLWPGAGGAALRSGAAATWSGIQWPCALVFLAGAGWVLAKRRPLRERFGLAVLCWGALLFIFLKGVETPVGLWSQRRFLPVVLVGMALLVGPASAGLADIAKRGWRWLAAALILLAGSANLIRWPAAYVTVNERGATEWTKNIAQRLGTNRWVIFDYYPHSVPYAAVPKTRVLGLGESSRDHWPEVAEWLNRIVQTSEVWVATSWSPVPLEGGIKLEGIFAVTGRFPVVRTKAFFPAERGEREVKNAFFRWVPVLPGDQIRQEKTMDGSPIGLRGPWGEIRQGATWSRQGSRILGPIPPKNQRVEFEVECAWPSPDPDWPEQILQVDPPWEGEALRWVIPAGNQIVRGVLTRPGNDQHRALTGGYAFRVDRPFNPADYGLRGYTNDLGVAIRRIIIQVESGGLSVPD